MPRRKHKKSPEARPEDFEVFAVWERQTGQRHQMVKTNRDCTPAMEELAGKTLSKNTLIVVKNHPWPDGTTKCKMHIFPPEVHWQFCDRYLILG